MNDYEEFVAWKADALLKSLKGVGVHDPEVAKLYAAMRGDLEAICRKTVQLPSNLLDGWSYYFSPDGPDGIYGRFPELVQLKAELSFALRRPDMDSYERACRTLGVPFVRPNEST